jgi:acetoacetyl-CoA synthetase
MDQFDAIADCVVVGQHWKNDTRVILFVQMASGRVLDETLCQEIRHTIRVNASPRHVPAKIIAVPDVPYTLNMKKVELAVRKVIHGEPVTNKDALRNPEALDHYVDLPELQAD